MLQRLLSISVAAALIGSLVGCTGDSGPTSDSGPTVDTHSNPEAAADLLADASGVTDTRKDAGAGADTMADGATGVVARGGRLLGLALSGAVDDSGEEEPFGAQRALMDELGAEFINLALDWRTLEPGPGDDFSYRGLDGNRWTTSSAPAPVSPGDIVTYTGGTSEIGWMRARYVLKGRSAAQIDWSIPAGAANGTTLTLLWELRGQGNRCEPGDTFVALVLTKGATDHALSVVHCRDGAFTTPAVKPYNGSLEHIIARIERDQTQLKFLVGGEQIHALALSSELRRDARPYLYVDGQQDSPAAVKATMDNWSVGSSEHAFDAPGLRYSVNPGFFDLIAAINQVYRGIKVGVSVRTINTNATELPDDLTALRDRSTGRVDFAHPRIAERFDRLVQHLLRGMDDHIELVFFSLGNEVDAYLGDDSAAWEAYAEFVETVAPTVRSHLDSYHGGRDGVPVGVKLTHDVLALGSEIQRQVDRIIAASDATMYNFYPLGPGFELAPASSIKQAFSAAVERFDPEKPILVTEFGVHSADAANPVCRLDCPTCSGGEALQASHYRTLFETWDEHADRIELVMLNWLTDVPCGALDIFAKQYGSDHPAFLSYLATLGVRRSDGTRKPAFAVIANETARRGW